MRRREHRDNATTGRRGRAAAGRRAAPGRLHDRRHRREHLGIPAHVGRDD